MAQITLQGNPINTIGELPEVGSAAPEFTLVGEDLSEVTLAQYAGKRLVLNVFPSIDTPVCQASTKEFNKRVADLENVDVLCVSRDLPFAYSRYCGAEGIKNLKCASSFRHSFGDAYGVSITDGPLQGLLSRAVLVLDENGVVRYSEQVPEIAQEPDYDAALSALK